MMNNEALKVNVFDTVYTDACCYESPMFHA